LEEENFLSIIKNKKDQIKLIQKEIDYERIENEIIKNKSKILEIENNFKKEICVDLPTTIWHRSSFEVDLPCEENFNDKMIPTKQNSYK